MKISISSDNIDLSESMKVLATQKLEKFKNHIKEDARENSTIRAVLNSGPEDNFVVRLEAVIVGKGKNKNEKFFAEDVGFELESAIVGAVDDLDRQYLKFKEINEEAGWKEKRNTKSMSDDDLYLGA